MWCMNNTEKPRKPSGSPEGGQWAAQERAESDVDLSAESFEDMADRLGVTLSDEPITAGDLAHELDVENVDFFKEFDYTLEGPVDSDTVFDADEANSLRVGIAMANEEYGEGGETDDERLTRLRWESDLSDAADKAQAEYQSIESTYPDISRAYAEASTYADMRRVLSSGHTGKVAFDVVQEGDEPAFVNSGYLVGDDEKEMDTDIHFDPWSGDIRDWKSDPDRGITVENGRVVIDPAQFVRTSKLDENSDTQVVSDGFVSYHSARLRAAHRAVVLSEAQLAIDIRKDVPEAYGITYGLEEQTDRYGNPTGAKLVDPVLVDADGNRLDTDFEMAPWTDNKFDYEEAGLPGDGVAFVVFDDNIAEAREYVPEPKRPGQW